MEEPQIEPRPIESPVPSAPRTWTRWLALGGVFVLLCSAAFIAVLVFGGRALVDKLLPPIAKPASQAAHVQAEQNTLGDPNAPLHMIEYGDFQCPFCLRFWKESEPQLIKDYVQSGKLFFEFRAFPIIGPESYLAAQGAYCAGDQGKFWEYHDTLFTNWSGENAGEFEKDKLNAYAKLLDLDLTQFEACVNDGKYVQRVQDDKHHGEVDGVQATPTFFINGAKLEGAQPFEVFKVLIDNMLKGDFHPQSG